MTLASDMQGDFEAVIVGDFGETVTFMSRNGNDNFVSTEDVSALREARTRDDGQGPPSGKAAESRVRWHLANADMGGVEPKPRDRIKDAANVQYVVTGVRLESWGSRWVCETVRAVGT